MSTLDLRIHAYTPADAHDPSVRTRLQAWSDFTNVKLKLHVGGTVPSWIRNPQPRSRHDTTLVFRNMFKASTGYHEARVLESAGLGIYELDDGLPWDNGRLPDLGAWWKIPFRRDRLARRAAAAADRIIVGNHLLQEWAEQHSSDVRFIPTCVNVNDYEKKTDYRIGQPKLVWIGSRATEFELVKLAPALAEVHHQTGARLVIVGAAGVATDPLLAPFSERVPWSLAVQRSVLRVADIGLMPLSDGLYQRAKCGYKLLQYGAAAVPAVASPVGVNAEMLTSGLGSAATTHRDWVEHLTRLIHTSDHERKTLATHAYNTVLTTYTYDVWAQRWIEAVKP
jgi:glycosyltransferase involved in cell wall biosynthesis